MPEPCRRPATAPEICSIDYASSGGDTVYTLTPANIRSMDPQKIGNSDALLQILNSYPQGNDPTQGDGLNSIGYRFPYTIHRKYDTYIARLDWNANAKHNFFWRGNLQNDSEPAAPAFPGQPPRPPFSPTARDSPPATRS